MAKVRLATEADIISQAASIVTATNTATTASTTATAASTAAATAAASAATALTAANNANTGLGAKISTSQIGVAGGVADLDGTGKVPASRLPTTTADGGSALTAINAMTSGTVSNLTSRWTFLPDTARAGRITIQAVNDPNGSADRGLILKAMGPLARPGVCYYDSTDRFQVWAGWHDQLPDGGVHHGYEIKTSTDPAGLFPAVMATRFRITTDGNQGVGGTNGDLAVASFFSVSNVVIENGKSTPGTPFGLVFNTPKFGDIVAATANQGNYRPLKITCDVDASANAIAYIAVGIPNGANSNASASLRMFRETNVAGAVDMIFYKGDNTSTQMAKIDAKNGILWAMGADGITLKKAVLEDDARMGTAATKASIGLANVDNTSDLLKATSTDTQNKLNRKPEIVEWNTGTGWGSYSTSTSVIRWFDSSWDAAATAPTAYYRADKWIKSPDAP